MKVIERNFLIFIALMALAAAYLLFAGRPEAQDSFIDPHIYIEDTFITASGIVTAVEGERFVLDYGTGMINVDMEGFEPRGDSAARLIFPGESVTVGGVVTGGPGAEGRAIRAGGVHVHDRDIHYYAGMVWDDMPGVTFAPVIDWVAISGMVQSMQPTSLVLATEMGPIRVDIDRMVGSPMPHLDLERIQAGDHVRITGILDDEFFANRTVDAFSLVALDRDFE